MIILGVDLGKARTGLAICDKDEIIATPLGIIEEKNRERLVASIIAKAAENRVEQMVIGLPRNMDGTEGESARNAREIGEKLAEESGLHVEFMDERGTTVSAHNFLNETNTRGKKRKAVVDAVAAVIILQNYLDYRRNHGFTSRT